MLFVQIVLGTYVPEGLSQLVDALADPRGWANQQEKRQMDLAKMGIAEEDIGEYM